MVNLSPTHTRLLALVHQGRTNAQIARELGDGWTVTRVSSILHRLCQRLGVERRTGLVLFWERREGN